MLKKIGVFSEVIDNIDEEPEITYHKKGFALRSEMGAEFSYIQRNLLNLFPGRVDIAKNLMFSLNSLTADDIVLLFEYLAILLDDKLENSENLSEAIEIFRWIRLDDEIEIDITRNLNGFMSWIGQNKNRNTEKLQFKIIFLHNLLMASRIYEFTDYINQSPINQSDDNVFISTLESSIIDHLFFISKDSRYLESIFSFNNIGEYFSQKKIQDILDLIDSSSIESSFKKKKKRVEKILIDAEPNNNYVENNIEQSSHNENLCHVSVGKYGEWTEDIIPGSERKISTNLRQNQQAFRNSVIGKYGSCCSVCSIDILELVEAAHIISKKDRGVDSPKNGLPLCVLHHKAYDANLFCIHPETLHVVTNPIGPSLEQLLITKSSICDLKLHPPRDVLAWRWNNWLNCLKDGQALPIR